MGNDALLEYETVNRNNNGRGSRCLITWSLHLKVRKILDATDIDRKVENYKLELYEKDKEWILNTNKRLKALVDQQIEYMEKSEKFDAEMVRSLFDLTKLIKSSSSSLLNEG